MKLKFVDLFLFITFSIALTITGVIYFRANKQIGDITYDPYLDSESFKICGDNILQYYQVGTYYEGGRKAFREQLKEVIKNLHFNELEGGYITYRFIVNCKGEIGFFRVKSTNINLKKIVLNSSKEEILENALKSLKNWIPGHLQGESVDSYFQIHFKIQNGKIIDIF